MVEANSEQNTASAGFDYCFWSKLLVAIVLFPLVAYIAASFFTSVAMKFLFALLALGAIVYAAIKIDQIPCLAVKIPALIGKGAKSE